ncbi:hemin uptake protein HemP [Anatilimnocola sp. NA78]|uniref:hemin uptake protein HemP n=1 Tax=Anatilimnocola sp. NA78 TaxID=3415683 RepID=UPI003CE5917C
MNESNLPPDKKSESTPTQNSAGASQKPRVYRSDELFGGDREIWIEHGDLQYRLRITSAGKLVLNK